MSGPSRDCEIKATNYPDESAGCNGSHAVTRDLGGDDRGRAPDLIPLTQFEVKTGYDVI